MIKFKDLILHEDADYMVINKPYDIATLDDRDATKPFILKLAKGYWPEAQVCHRLDKETSGILVLAKNPEAYRNLSLQFENREVVKIYHAVINGSEKLENQMVELPIFQMKDGIVKIDYEKGKPSATIFNTLNAFKGFSLVACLPITGRMHQIRIHLAAIGRPIVSDVQYGGTLLMLSALKKRYKHAKDTDEQPLIKRVALHAQSITFKNCFNESITVEAPYPKDIQALLRQLQLHAG